MDEEKHVNSTMRRSDTVMRNDMKTWRQQPAKDPFLVIMSGQEKGKKVLLVSSSMLIGRSTHANIQIFDPRVSRQHARITKESGDFVIIDQESANGTWINGHKVTSQILRNGDHIVVGSTEMLLTIPEIMDGTSD